MWNDVFPNLLIGLREGLEAGLIVSILLATLVRSGAERQKLQAVWAGVGAAVLLSLCFGAVLTFAAANMSTHAEEAFSGFLGVVAVGFVTWMVFWMRRSAPLFAGELSAKVTTALGLGAGVLAFTAFVAVVREGLETSLFIWATTRTATESLGPLVGAATGIGISIVICWGLYRRVLKINLSRFFVLTGIVLIVIAAGVFAYSIKDLQESGILPGYGTYAFNVGSYVDPSSWYARLIEGTFNLTPAMTLLQVFGYVGYLIPVIILFVRRRDPVTLTATEPKAAVTEPVTTSDRAPWFARVQLSALRRFAVPVAVAVALLVTLGVILILGPKSGSAADKIRFSADSCAPDWTAADPGHHTFEIQNAGERTGEVYLLDPQTDAVYGEVEKISPGTSRLLEADLGSGSYAWRCIPDGSQALTSNTVNVTGGVNLANSLLPVSEDDLADPIFAYRALISTGLSELVAQTDQLQNAIAQGDLAGARKLWLSAHLTYETLGAAYGTFGEYDQRIDGRPDGLEAGIADPEFTGFLRIEHGLWNGEPAQVLSPIVQQLNTDVHELQGAFPTQPTDPVDLPLRAHEILENTLQFELTGATDQGSGTNLATTSANVTGTRMVLDVLRPLLQERKPELLNECDVWLNRFSTEVEAQHHADGSWASINVLTLQERQQLNGTLGELLETLAPIPDILEIRGVS